MRSGMDHTVLPANYTMPAEDATAAPRRHVESVTVTPSGV